MIGKLFRQTRQLTTATVYGFIRDECYAKASALSFYSLVAVVPILAVAFGIAKGFGFEQNLEDQILHGFYQQETVAKTLIGFAHSLLEETKGGVIAGVGFILLLWTVMGLLGSLEHSLNAIWKAPSARPYSRKFSDYLAIMVFCPIFFVASSSLNFYIFSYLIEVADTSGFSQTTRPVLLALFHFTPFVLSWMLFSFIYIFIPNVKTSWISGILAGILAGTCFLLVQWIYIHFQVGMSKYNAIYGSFAAIPLFLGWVQTSWIILFAGAEFSYQLDRHRYFPYLKTSEDKQEAASRQEIGLMILTAIMDAFRSGKTPESLNILAERLGAPLKICRELVNGFEEARILFQVDSDKGEEIYLPAKVISLINLKSFLEGLEASQREIVIVYPSPELEKARSMLQNIDKHLESIPLWD